MTRIVRVYKPEELGDTEERKRKWKGITIESNIRMLVMKRKQVYRTLERNKYSVVE